MVNAIDRARLVQLEASQPLHSVMLRASAGSGKTTALVNRFLRLCLEDTPARAAPGTVLAVTFTRKAAVEIQERLRREARELALADPAVRAARLARLFGKRDGRAPDAGEVAAAGALYEQLLADTSALQLGTIHSFCQVVLGRFAREAGLDPTFGILENVDDLHDEAFDLLVGEIAADPLLGAAAGLVGAHPDSLRRRLQPCLDEAMRLELWLAAHGHGARARVEAGAGGDGREPRTAALPHLAADLRGHLFPGLAGDGDPLPALGDALAGALATFARELPAAAEAAFTALPGKSRATIDGLSQEAAALALGWRAPGATAEAGAVADLARAAFALLLTKQGKVRSFTLVRDAAFKAEFNALVATCALPVLALLRDIDRAGLLEQNLALLRLGLRLLDHVDDLKRRDRVVDFQDLEDIASGLLSDGSRAQELQYRLDEAIAHILVDEFQDTNVNQWSLLAPFVDEFRAGGGERTRTFFLVGDVKQSIYGFRGAWPQIFLDLESKMGGYDCRVLELPTNFRSRRAVVEGVGELFNTPPLAGRLEAGQQDGVRQAWARTDASGTFIVHAPFPDPDDPDRPGSGGGEAVAARAAAQLVRNLREAGEPVFDPVLGATRPLQWRDILVLARTRTAFALYERAFRDAGIPFLPPGRGMLAASREVQDILALLRWLAWPDDNAALATVLRSPIARLGEGAFQRLLAARGVLERRDDGRWRDPQRSLWQAVRESGDPQVTAAAALLAQWRRKLDFETCHDLLRRIAREAGLTARYQAALGEQARFNLERLFDLALGSDVLATPTARRLAEVIARAAGRGDQEEAALPSDGEGRVRFLTVHGAKGLEAPVVLLVDADRGPGRDRAQVYLESAGGPQAVLLGTTAGQRGGFQLPEGVEPPVDPLAGAVRRARDRNEAERAHLLYVALTRARDRLHVLGGDRDRGGRPHESPLRDLREAAAAIGRARGDDAPLAAPAAGDDALHDIAAPAAAETARGLHALPPTPSTWSPPRRRGRFVLVRPSAAADDLRPDDGTVDDTAGASAPRPAGRRAGGELPAGVSPAAHGDLVHRLLQAACAAGRVPPGAGVAHDEAAAVFGAAALAWIFTVPEEGAAWSEAPVIARRAPGPDGVEQRITGVIDRLLVRPDRVDIIDYKTNRGAADPIQRGWLIEHYRPQLEAYREVLRGLYPDRPVRTWLLFTDPEVAASDRLQELA